LHQTDEDQKFNSIIDHKENENMMNLSTINKSFFQRGNADASQDFTDPGLVIKEESDPSLSHDQSESITFDTLKSKRQ
jgi:hypothetical protein